jgi:hypothetical protein
MARTGLVTSDCKRYAYEVSITYVEDSSDFVELEGPDVFSKSGDSN